MLKRSLISAGLLLTLAASLNAYQSGWMKVEPLGGGFSIMMPAKPEEKVKPSEEFTFHSFTVNGERAIYLASYGDYAPSIKLNSEAELIANRDNFLKGVNATLIESRKITLDGHAGLEFIAENEKASFKSRIYLMGNRVHQLAVAIFKEQDDSDNVNRFFGSFSFSSNQDHNKP
jgi:hypothetical protein